MFLICTMMKLKTTKLIEFKKHSIYLFSILIKNLLCILTQQGKNNNLRNVSVIILM